MDILGILCGKGPGWEGDLLGGVSVGRGSRLRKNGKWKERQESGQRASQANEERNSWRSVQHWCLAIRGSKFSRDHIALTGYGTASRCPWKQGQSSLGGTGCGWSPAVGGAAVVVLRYSPLLGSLSLKDGSWKEAEGKVLMGETGDWGDRRPEESGSNHHFCHQVLRKKGLRAG